MHCDAPHVDSISAAIRNAKQAGQSGARRLHHRGISDTRESFLEQLRAVAAAADVVEIGVPFTDPMADGTTIQRSSRAALEQGVSLRWILSELSGDARRPAAPLLLMSYLNPLLAYGLDKLPADAARAGVAGFIVPDLPYEECARAARRARCAASLRSCSSSRR